MLSHIYPPEILCTEVTQGSYLSSLLANTLKSNQVEVGAGGRGGGIPVARLREPRDPCSLPREPDCALEAPRWPIECQVVEGRIQHIEAVPQTPEAYYEPTGLEIQPKPIGDDHGTTLFQYHPMSAVTYNSDDELAPKIISLPKCVHNFSRSTARRTLMENGFCYPRDTLVFESRFESGNLAKAVKITDTYYELTLRTDLYTNRHVQWFYFMVENTKRGLTYRFSIVNFSKGESLYSEGMKPVMYSTRDAVLNKLGWRRFGTNISYFKNEPVNGEDDGNCTYTLSFNVEFPHDDDCVYIAHSYPYTYTDLQHYLLRLQSHPVKSIYTKLRLLCKTLAGNNVYYLTVTEPPHPDDLPKKKKAVVVTARVHPGETPASWMMKGLIDYLTSDTSQAKELREKFIFKLIPMLNPDGVIVGNNRCSLTGRDLNRQYRTVIRETYPPVWHTKLMIKRLLEECGIAMYCDFHAHSRKHNVFIYGCENKRLPDKRLQEQIFPLMLHKNTADKFSFESCKFRIQRSKEGTGRVVVWMMGVANSYTMEASFSGSTLGRRSGTHFTTSDYESIGRSFCETLLDFVDDAPSKEKLRLKIMMKLQKGGSSADEPANINISDYTSDDGDSEESSGDEDGPKQKGKQLTAPPCSPASPSPPLSRIKEGGSAKLTRQQPIVLTSPQRRKTIPIGKAILEVEWSEEEEGVSDSERDGEGDATKGCGGSPAIFGSSPLKSAISPAKQRKPDVLPPPQLIVTSAKQAQRKNRFSERSKSADFTRGINEVEKPRIYKSPGRGGEVEVKSTASLQTLLLGASDFTITWAHFSKQQDKILRSCSKKLAQFVRSQKNKKDKKSKLEKDEEKSTFRKKVKLKGTRSGKVDQSSSSVEAKDGKNYSLKIKSIKSSECDKSALDKKKAVQATKTFRKGGIVVTATVNSKKIKGNENIAEIPILKKKKKKKKLIQLQSKVKSVFSIVSSTNK